MTADSGRRRTRWTLAAAGVVVATTVVVVVLYGLVPYPDVTPLLDQPVPPVSATLAVLHYDSGAPCMDVVEGDGSVHELGCGSRFEGFGLAWLDRDRLALRTSNATRPIPVGEEGPADSGDGSPVIVLDARTGETIEVTTEGALGSALPGLDQNRSGVASVGGDGVAVWLDVEDPDGRVRQVATLTGPATYSLFDPRLSADGDWIVVQDSIGRVLVVDAAGDIGPRVWLDDLTGEYAVN